MAIVDALSLMGYYTLYFLRVMAQRSCHDNLIHFSGVKNILTLKEALK